MTTYSLKTQASYLFFSKIIAYIVGSVSPIILVRLLSPYQFGTYRQILFIASFLLPLIALRIPESLYYFLPEKRMIWIR